MSEKDVVLYEVADYVATVTLNRPERRNALSVAAFNGLTEIWKDVDKNPKVRVVILTGSDCGTFCAGMDLKEASEIRAKRGIDIIELIQDPFCRVMREVKKPIIAAMNGHAPAGGMMLTLNSDIRIGLAGSTLGITEVHIGRGSPWAMPAVWMMPTPLLLELTLVGNFMPIERFHQVGFVNYLEPTAAKVMERARTLAARIAEGAPLSVEAAKLSTKAAMDLVVGHAIKEATQIHERAYQSEDAIEGPSAFAEKRKPVWKGR
ncbi:MAG: enoyl-CoA hydratase/isomerase family protein [Alphaproteobacteria bacterium]